MDTMYTRRTVLALGGASLLALALPMPALALTEGQARGLIDGLVGEINSVIASGKSERAMYTDFERIFRTYGDIPYIAAYALGNDGRTATAAQKKAFSDAFTGYISRKYGKRFREFIGGRLEVQSVKAVKNYYEVQTTAFLRGTSPFTVSFHVSDRTGRPLLFNLFIEGVNMLLTERTEVGAMLDRRRGNIDALIQDLRTAS
ncbi:MAG: MlaC/ttg2D family ABC transporter substrate-binding protein [Sagittula sp.]|jgi:phospholipid transport system substrate-binding protein|uniref:MlaC/ttg2D family ABC transporter substrate-binding protein n=1 Tax=unclassified Sagittula TaxID=2624628 RepID=UPI0018E23271|nr:MULTISPECIES: ABC transporter substrate-binding protein [unclassified Sagittula]WHZ35861.1 ABC transporter substrate-binding protein [Sagittula sp. MA-2]